MIETVSLEKAAEGYGRMARNEARLRMVIAMERVNSQVL
jgi:D-arabinose 1-dehydrogenase-like Zn-dependent alcohol dehydrogenase